MQVPLAVLADYANLTLDGKLNIMGIFQGITAPNVPITHPQMQLVILFQVEPAERGKRKEIEITLLDADGAALLKLGQEIIIPENIPANTQLPQIAQINGISFNKYGDYAFHILVNGETKATVRFAVSPLSLPQSGS